MKFQLKSSLAVGLAAAILTACGGGGTPNNTGGQVNLGGVVATGAAVVGASVTVTDSTGATRTTTSNIDGSYNLNITGLVAPFVIRAEATLGDSQLVLVSVLTTAPSAPTTGSASAVANVTPLTSAVAALIAPAGTDPASLSPSQVTAASVQTALDNLNTALAAVLTANGLPANYNPMTGTLVANSRTGADAVLETIHIQNTGAGVQITNTAAPDSASVPITGVAGVPAGTQPPAPTALSAPPAGYTLGYLDHFKAQLNACFAQPSASRATVVNGLVTTALGACDNSTFKAMSSTYMSGGYTSLQRYNGLLSDPLMDGAQFSFPEPLFNTTVGNATTDLGNTTYFKMNYVRTDGEKGMLTDVARRTNTYTDVNKWQIHGNQRNLDMVIEGRASKFNQLNAASGTTEASRFSTQMRLFVNPLSVGGSNVQLVRIKGAGLPAAGVVMGRSTACGTGDYLAIFNKTGVLNSASTMYWYSSGTSNTFTLNSEAIDTSVTLQWNANSSTRASTPLTQDEIAQIPNFGSYTVEVWYRNADQTYKTAIPGAADLTYNVRSVSRPASLEQVRAMQWNDFTAASKLYLDPTNSLAGVASSLQLGWIKNPLAEPVESVSVYGENAVAGISTLRVTGGSGVRLAERSKTITPGAIGAGYAQASVDCTTTQLPALTSTAGTINANNQYTGTYRDMTLRSRTQGLVRKYNTFAWSNYP